MSWKYWLPEIVVAVIFVINIALGYNSLTSFLIGICAGVLLADYRRRDKYPINLDELRTECETLWLSKKKK